MKDKTELKEKKKKKMEIELRKLEGKDDSLKLLTLEELGKLENSQEEVIKKIRKLKVQSINQSYQSINHINQSHQSI